MKLDDDTVVTAAQLSWLLGLSDRALRNYANRGVVVRAGRGKYRLGESVRRLYHHASEAAAGRSGTNLSDARARLAAAQTEGQEMKNAVLRGELIRVADYRMLLEQIAVAARNMMLSWPSRLAFDTPAMTAVDVARGRRMVENDLHDMSWERGYGAIGKGDAAPDDEGDDHA
jgi:terminase small subunit / prophage DNA-packing protein